jgi:sarcosine oxidase
VALDLPDGRAMWGHGSSDGFDVKIGATVKPLAGTLDPDEIDRRIRPHEDVAALAAIIEDVFPGVEPVPTESNVCVWAESADSMFLLGPITDSGRVVVQGGDSGHGFKHAAAIGELAAQVVAGEEPFIGIAFMDPRRAADPSSAHASSRR